MNCNDKDSNKKKMKRNYNTIKNKGKIMNIICNTFMAEISDCLIK